MARAKPKKAVKKTAAKKAPSPTKSVKHVEDNFACEAKTKELTEIEMYYIRNEYDKRSAEQLAQDLKANLATVKDYIAKLPVIGPPIAGDMMARHLDKNKKPIATTMTPAASQMADEAKATEPVKKNARFENCIYHLPPRKPRNA